MTIAYQKPLTETCYIAEQGLYIGVMSGTSLDGMDAVVVKFTQSQDNNDGHHKTNSVNGAGVAHNNQAKCDHIKPVAELSIELITTYTKAFPPLLHQVLFELCQPNGVANLLTNNWLKKDAVLSQYDTDTLNEFTKFSELDWFGWASREYASFTSNVINEMLKNAKIDRSHICAIGCHGQTVRHRPKHGFSLQLVDANLIAEQTGIDVISDFRRRDMAVGGQGAPLVPAFHQAVFQHPLCHRVILNLGGIANITVLSNTTPTFGYDTGPANLLLDAWATEHTQKPYDENGDFARCGHIIQPLLEQLLCHPYFALPTPKSTGREDFNMAWLQQQLTLWLQAQQASSIESTGFTAADVQATLTELTVLSACHEIEKHSMKDASTTAVKPQQKNELWVCGGGAFNGYLLTRLQHHLPDWQVLTTAKLGLAPTWVEATAFAWLARQSMLNKPSNLPEVTGANKAVVLGQLCKA